MTDVAEWRKGRPPSIRRPSTEEWLMSAPTPIGRTMIETHDLRRSFKTRSGTIDAVKGVDLTVPAGQVFGFLGPNGAGKTTTLRMLATLLPPSGGAATIAGADLRREPALVRERIG